MPATPDNVHTSTPPPARVRPWDEDGYLLLRDVISQQAIEALRGVFVRVVDTMIARAKADGLIRDEMTDLPFETRFSRALGVHANRFGRSWREAITSRALFELHREPKLVAALAQVIGPEVRGHAVWNARPKVPGQQLTVVPWHQDSGYFGPQSVHSRIITAWIPLVDVDAAMGAIQVIPGSHRGGLVKHRTEERDGKFLEIDAPVDASGAVTCEMHRGDALLFGNLLFHRSLATTRDTIRWSVDLRFYPEGDDPGSIHWPDPKNKWVIASRTEPPTTFEQWQAITGNPPW